MMIRMMPPATDNAPAEKCSSLRSTSPRTASDTAAAAAVVIILRATRRFVGSSIAAVASMNGTSAIFGPTPMSSRRNISTRTSKSSDLMSMSPGVQDA